VFWTGSYFVASCGGVTIETLKQYVENQTAP
ncbi:transposase, partial [Spirulina sp. CS-785/01]